MEKQTKNNGYRWEKDIERSWESIDEDPTGNLIASNINEQVTYRYADEYIGGVKRGIIRHLVLVLDLSESIARATDFPPSRIYAVKVTTEEFIKAYFTQCPISMLAIVVIKNGKADCISPLSSEIDAHIKVLADLFDMALPATGACSYSNGLDVALSQLLLSPEAVSKELLVFGSSFASFDAVSDMAILSDLEKLNVRLHVIQFGCSYRLLQHLSERSSGVYTVPVDMSHLKSILHHLSIPLPETKEKFSKPALLPAGFPIRVKGERVCGCHNRLVTDKYQCSRCKTSVCAVPSKCPTCQLSLASYHHLVRSSHHVRPLQSFTDLHEKGRCFLCYSKFNQAKQCPKCHTKYCSFCDDTLHRMIHDCPGCLSIKSDVEVKCVGVNDDVTLAFEKEFISSNTPFIVVERSRKGLIMKVTVPPQINL